MDPRRFFRPGAWASILICAGCNLFNPSGEGDVGADSDANLAQGETYFRQGNFAASMAAFEKSIREDSTNALGYYGYSKAVVRYYQLNASTIFNEISTAQKVNTIPFLGSDDATMTRYLQATSKVRRALGEMTFRDTLTRWYHYLQDTNATTVVQDPLHLQRIAFMRDYFQKAGQGKTGFRTQREFPLSNQQIQYEKVVADMGFVELLYALVHLRDLDQNDTIDSRDNLLKQLNFSTDKGLQVENLKDIADSLATPENRKNVNQLIQNVSAGLGSASTILNLISPNVAGSDSLSNQTLTNSVTQNMDSVIQSLGNAVTFYQFGDSLDNDGDGCVDEEILDGKDNDGDGLVDEDARVTPMDGIDNDLNGSRDLSDPGEMPNSDFALGYVTDPSFVKGPLYQDKPFRIRVQADSLATRTTFTTAQRVMLDSAKAQIGGCWNHYP